MPPQSLASPATIAAVTSIPFIPVCGGMMRTKPAASSDRQAAPLAAIAAGVSLRVNTCGLRSDVFRMKFEASSTASICMSAGPACGPAFKLPPAGVAAVCFGAKATEKSPAFATPYCFTLATQFASVGSSCAV
ncbi:hypothetical protein ES703_14101 [subsurface metagenome]